MLKNAFIGSLISCCAAGGYAQECLQGEAYAQSGYAQRPDSYARDEFHCRNCYCCIVQLSLPLSYLYCIW
jgi:hypothetical protein